MLAQLPTSFVQKPTCQSRTMTPHPPSPYLHHRQAFYLQLRADSSAAGAGSSPVTARQLESLVRLAEARARCELREVVTREDAEVCGACVGCVSWWKGGEGRAGELWVAVG
jgi:DNA helicase MCM8